MKNSSPDKSYPTRYSDFPCESESSPCEEELPCYEDIPANFSSPASIASHQVPTTDALQPQNEGLDGPPHIPFSTHDLSFSEIRTRFPNYSTDARALFNMISEQSLHPPAYYVQLHGKHNETRQTGNKEVKDEVTDFCFRINITHLLGPLGSGDLQCLQNNNRGFRGTCFPSLKPMIDEDLHPQNALFEWCQRYVADPSRIKSFIFSRKVINHDTATLYELLRTTIAETNYRGQLYVTFPKSYCKLIVYSPGTINKWRMTTSIRWFFYISFLWIFAWPLLMILTSRYETVKTIFYYADSADTSNPTRKCKVMSEVEWLQRWKKAIKSAALAGIKTGDSALTEDYRLAVERYETLLTTDQSLPSNPRFFSGSSSRFFGERLAVTRELNCSFGWGGDC
ncbi:hypothetical protein K3495_g13442 [Podosphaera aphanis]|nr:hypothetical protein K3495_g13442 [Podosphaera aphanis]